jgi:hypothetical protein
MNLLGHGFAKCNPLSYMVKWVRFKNKIKLFQQTKWTVPHIMKHHENLRLFGESFFNNRTSSGWWVHIQSIRICIFCTDSNSLEQFWNCRKSRESLLNLTAFLLLLFINPFLGFLQLWVISHSHLQLGWLIWNLWGVWFWADLSLGLMRFWRLQ